MLQADLSEILAFVHVARGGSFTAAAARLALPKSTVSRKVSELETRMGARLLQRTTRSVQLTDIGQRYYERCTRVISELEEAAQEVMKMQSTPRGVLRISTPNSFSVLGPLLAEYLRLYPEVQLEVHSEGRRVDLVDEQFDVALRAGGSPDSSLVGRKVGVVRRCVLAAPVLVKRTGTLKHPSDLEQYECLVFAPEGSTWTLVSGAKELEVNVRSRLVANDYELLRTSARAGAGFALLPEFQCLEDVAAGRLVPVLQGWCAREVPIHAVYPSTRHVSPRVSALLELLRERLSLTLAAGNTRSKKE